MREAIIENNEVRCPYCRKKNLQLTGNEMVENLKIRCRGSKGGMEHYFILNTNRKGKVYFYE